MLIQFSLTNYRNFKETATLDLAEAKITEFKQHLYVDKDKQRVIPLAALYGANGSGKSNFLQGLLDLRQLLLHAPEVCMQDPRFYFSDSNTPVEYRIVFRVGAKEYEYQLKVVPNLVVEEVLFGRSLRSSQFDVLFDRDHEGVFLCKDWESVDVSELPEHLPLLYFLYQKAQEPEVIKLMEFFQNIVFYSGTGKQVDTLLPVLSQENTKQELLMHISNLGFPITDLQVGADGLVLTHTIQGHSATLPWEMESNGIRSIIQFLSLLIHARAHNTLVLADTPECGIHSHALQYLYRYVTLNAANDSSSQLLLATHETSNMNNALFRRDELWLTEQAADGSSHLYTLALFLKENGEKVRKDEVYYKQYLEGRYGAIPSIKNESK